MSDKHFDDQELLQNAIPIPHEEEEDETLAPLEMSEEEVVPAEQKPKITSFAERQHREVKWQRAPVKTGTGACHVRTFVTKLRLDAIEHIDEQVNAWLDEHPEYEVKFVTTSVGKMVGKTTEEALIMNVWV